MTAASATAGCSYSTSSRTAAVLRARQAELRGDQDLLADPLQRSSHGDLVGERSVGVRGVEEGDPGIDGDADDGGGVRAVGVVAVERGLPHAALRKRGTHQPLGAERSFLHGGSPSSGDGQSDRSIMIFFVSSNLIPSQPPSRPSPDSL